LAIVEKLQDPAFTERGIGHAAFNAGPMEKTGKTKTWPNGFGKLQTLVTRGRAAFAALGAICRPKRPTPWALRDIARNLQKPSAGLSSWVGKSEGQGAQKSPCPPSGIGDRGQNMLSGENRGESGGGNKAGGGGKNTPAGAVRLDSRGGFLDGTRGAGAAAASMFRLIITTFFFPFLLG